MNDSANKRYTINDVAAAAGVSKTIVSNYLNGKFETMSIEKKEQIAEIIKQFDYKPKNNRRNFKKRSVYTIGLVIADITDSFYAMLCKGITDASYKYNCHILIANTDNDIVREQAYIDSFINRADGLIIGTVGGNDEYLVSLKEMLPIVLADRSIHAEIYDLVSSNNYEAMTEMMNNLLASGYESFGLFTEKLHKGMARYLRYTAFTDFIESNHLQQNASTHTVSIYDDKIMMRELIAFSEKNKGKKMVAIGVNGRTLLQLVAGINALGFKIPSQIGVCGYDDFEWARLIQDGITTINQPSYDIGFKTVELLVERMIDNAPKPPRTILLRSKIARRGSV